MKKLPKKITNRLRRRPSELLEVTQHHYQTQLDSPIVAAFPVLLRESLGSSLVKLLIAAAGIALLTAALSLVMPETGWVIAIGITVVAVVMCSSNSKTGIVVATETDFVLIELENKTSFEPGKATCRIRRPATLPKPRPYKHGAVLGDALPFKVDGSKGWRYAFLTDRVDYLQLIEALSGEPKQRLDPVALQQPELEASIY